MFQQPCPCCGYCPTCGRSLGQYQTPYLQIPFMSFGGGLNGGLSQYQSGLEQWKQQMIQKQPEQSTEAKQ